LLKSLVLLLSYIEGVLGGRSANVVVVRLGWYSPFRNLAGMGSIFGARSGRLEMTSFRSSLSGFRFIGTFAVPHDWKHHFVRVVYIGRNHLENDQVRVSAWEILGSLIE
jgi:hypothetical protein